MPGYKTHITWSSAAGIALGSAAYLWYGVSLPQAVFGGVLCSLGGILPDIDSDNSQAFRRCVTTISGVCVLLLASRLRDFALEPEAVVTTCAGVYFFIVYVIGGMVSKLSIHRGMFHSIPFAVIAGEVLFILSSGDTQLRLFKSASIFFGVLIHLTLDEINSVSVLGSGNSNRTSYSAYNNGYEAPYYNNGYQQQNYRKKRSRKRRFQVVRIKSSFGTALKLIDYKHMGSTVVFYIVMAFLGHCAMGVQDFLSEIGDVNQAEVRRDVQGRLAIERVQRIYPVEYDLSVLRWVAANKLVLTPGQEDNKKWAELEALLAIGEDAARQKEEEAQKSRGLFNTPKDEKSDVEPGKKRVSLLDIINWNSMNQQKEEPSSQAPTEQ